VDRGLAHAAFSQFPVEGAHRQGGDLLRLHVPQDLADVLAEAALAKGDSLLVEALGPVVLREPVEPPAEGEFLLPGDLRPGPVPQGLDEVPPVLLGFEEAGEPLLAPEVVDLDVLHAPLPGVPAGERL
jgi:hypothetical protein